MAGADINIQQIKDGELAVTYDLGALAYGKTMGDLVARELTGEKLDNKVVDAPEGTVFTADNVDEYVPWSEQLKYVDIPSTF